MGLIFEFFGGPRDGEVLLAGSECLQGDEIHRRCAQGEATVIGQRINCATLYAETIWTTCSDSAIQDFLQLGYRFPNHTYEVTSRHNVGSDVRLSLEYVAAATAGAECRTCPLRDAMFPKG